MYFKYIKLSKCGEESNTAIQYSILFVNCIVNWKLKSTIPRCANGFLHNGLEKHNVCLQRVGQTSRHGRHLFRSKARVRHAKRACTKCEGFCTGKFKAFKFEKNKQKKRNKQSAISKFPKFHLHFQISRQKLITNVGFIGQLLSVHSVHSPPRLDFGCISSTQHAVPGPWSQWDICEHWENATKRLEKCVKTCDVSCFQRLEFHGITTSIL